MYKKGEYIVYASKGVCRITDITELDMMGNRIFRKYYILTPFCDENATLYLPIDNEKVTVRRVISSEEAQLSLIHI